MKVAYIISMLPAGITAWNYREIDILINNNVDIHAYPLTWTNGQYMPKKEWHFFKISNIKTILSQFLAFISSPLRYMRLFLFSLKTKTTLEFLIANYISTDMKANGIEHIHSHFGDRKLFTGYYCSKILGLPLTVTVHAYEILKNPNKEMFIIAANHCKKVVTVSDFNKKEITRIFGIDPDKIEVIHIHGDMSDERLQTSVKLFIAAAFVEKKGYDVLLNAIKKLNRKDITLWIAGDGPIDVRKMARDIGVEDITVFFGNVGAEFIKVLYGACDIFVLPSKTASTGDREGIPVAIMEAMSFHKPVISTKHVGIPELVPEILVNENDVDGLAEAIAYLADNPEIRNKQGETNYQIIKNEYSDDAVDKLSQIFTN